HANGHAAIASGGDVVVFQAAGTHGSDLFAVTRASGAWREPRELTTASSHPYHLMPAISDDGARVIFDCGPEPYGQAGTGLCEVAIDGSGFRAGAAPRHATGRH